MLIEWKKIGKSFDPQNFFPEKRKICIEIGFGKGDFLEIYSKNFGENLIGIEISEYSVRNAIKRLSAYSNIRLIHAEAFFAIGHLFKKSTVDKIFIIFPDPWPKKKQEKKRFLNKEFFDRASYILKDKGEIFIITDEEKLSAYIEKIIPDNFLRDKTPQNYVELAKNTKYGKKWKNLNKKFYDFFLLKKWGSVKYWEDILTGKRFDHILIEKFDEEKFSEKIKRIYIKGEKKFISSKNFYRGEKSFIIEFILKEETLLQNLFFKGEILKDKCVIKILNKEDVIFTKGFFEIVDNLSL